MKKRQRTRTFRNKSEPALPSIWQEEEAANHDASDDQTATLTQIVDGALQSNAASANNSVSFLYQRPSAFRGGSRLNSVSELEIDSADLAALANLMISNSMPHSLLATPNISPRASLSRVLEQQPADTAPPTNAVATVPSTQYSTVPPLAMHQPATNAAIGSPPMNFQQFPPAPLMYPPFNPLPYLPMQHPPMQPMAPLPPPMPAQQPPIPPPRAHLQQPAQQQLSQHTQPNPPLRAPPHPPQTVATGNYESQQVQQTFVHRTNNRHDFHKPRRSGAAGKYRKHANRYFGHHRRVETESMERCLIERRVCDMIMTPDGSRYIQNQFASMSKVQRASLSEQVLKSDRYSMLDFAQSAFGNWVIQLLYQHGGYAQREEIVNSVRGYILALSLNEYGCRLVQKMVSTGNDAEDVRLKQLIVAELHGKVATCINNVSGHHVIESILKHCPASLCVFILHEITDSLMVLSNDPFATQIVELFFSKFRESEITHLLTKITENITELSQHKYGNYLIQDVIESSPVELTEKMYKIIFENVEQLACNKYSSNVVEKSIYLASDKRRRKLVRLIMNNDSEEQQDKSPQHTYLLKQEYPILRKLIYDQFGNYVLQTLLSCSGAKDRQKLMTAIDAICPDLGSTPYGKHINGAINKIRKQRPSN